jgi:hypothetical protein
MLGSQSQKASFNGSAASLTWGALQKPEGSRPRGAGQLPGCHAGPPIDDMVRSAETGPSQRAFSAPTKRSVPTRGRLGSVTRRPDHLAALAVEQPRQTMRPRQMTLSVTADVRNRFDGYRLKTGYSNTAIVFGALNERLGKYADLIAARKVALQPDELFGGDYVPGRRCAIESSHHVQLSFQPTDRERLLLQAHAAWAGADSVSELVDAVLDVWLPRLTRPHPRPGR